MDTIFMSSENSKTFKPHVLILKLTDKLDLRRGEKSVALSNFIIYYTWKNIKKSYNKNKFKISEYLKKHNGNIDNPSIRIYVMKIEIELHLKLKQDIILSF